MTAQTSSEFESIFNAPSSAPSNAPSSAPSNASPSPPASRSHGGRNSFGSQGSGGGGSGGGGSFDDFGTAAPRQGRSQTNTAFVDFGAGPQGGSVVDSVVDSNRWSVGGSFANGGLGGGVSDDEGGEDDDDDGVMEAADPSMFHAPPRNRQPGDAGGGRSYSVTFESEKKLGMLLERHDEWVDGAGKPGTLKECTLVKLVVEHGAADVKGITLGSRVMAVNGRDTKNLAYLDTLNLVKTTPRPMTIVLQEGRLADDECVSGYCLLRKSIGPLPPSSFATWKRRYSEVGANVFYYTLMTTEAKFKMIKFGSDNADQIRDLHQHVTRYTGVN
ncbi:hypothetical protein TeGR_g7812 [Tetraparma gracilis]|uniref:PDZ domain-containing protein n=1 Tax=Tetraparma gracilis TaxID=2962635 RepID=A0ABQ6MQB0_9STRA|nr:hypothetical protein TeGR_g7812 [Tetraparma gracilis]